MPKPSPSVTPSTAACETVLHDEIAYNDEHACWPSETAIARRLLGYRSMLAATYDQLACQLEPHPRALSAFIGVVLQAAAHWTPEKLREARDERDSLERTNARISTLASELAELLAQREALHNQSGFAANTLYHPVSLIKAASSKNGRFRSYLREPLDGLAARFDLKYWPSLEDLCRALGEDAARAEVEATDPITAVGTDGQRASRTDFVLALWAGVEENREREHGPIPDGFYLTDDAWSALVSAALDLPADDIVDAGYIKGIRQRQRRRSAK